MTLQKRVLVAIEPVGFRQGVDGLTRQCRAALAKDPFCGAVFRFCVHRTRPSSHSEQGKHRLH